MTDVKPWVAGALFLAFAVTPVQSAVVDLPGTGSLRLAWVRESGTEVLDSGRPGRVELADGHGCLVIAPEAQPVRWQELALPSEAAALAKLLEPMAGSVVSGVLRTRDLRAYPPLVEASPVGRVIPESCRQGIAALETWREEVDAQARFELGPMAPGTWQVVMSAEFHKRITREVTVGDRAKAIDLGAVELDPVAVLGVRVESQWEEPPFELTLEKGERNATRDSWQYGEATTQQLAGTETEVELDVARYRVGLGKPGTELRLAEEVDLQPGEQELILRPVPFTVEGRVLRGERGVAGAILRVGQAGHQIELTAGSTGDFSIPLWRPAIYLVEVQPPDGTPEGILLDAREGEAGETLERDLQLGRHLLQGVVVAEADGSPLSGADVVVKQEGNMKLFGSSYTTGDDGTFAASIKEGMTKLTVTASARGYLRREIVLVDEVPGSRLVLSLERGVEVQGRVVGPSGAPVAGANVMGSAASPIAEPSCSAVSGADGSFTVTCPAGTVLFAAAPGYALGWAPAREGELTLPVTALQPPSLVAITAPSGEPAEGAAITVQGSTGMWIPFAVLARAQTLNGGAMRAGADGVLAVSTIPPGTWTAHLVMRAGSMPLGIVVLPAPSLVSLKLPPRPAT